MKKFFIARKNEAYIRTRGFYGWIPTNKIVFVDEFGTPTDKDMSWCTGAEISDPAFMRAIREYSRGCMVSYFVPLCDIFMPGTEATEEELAYRYPKHTAYTEPARETPVVKKEEPQVKEEKPEASARFSTIEWYREYYGEERYLDKLYQSVQVYSYSLFSLYDGEEEMREFERLYKEQEERRKKEAKEKEEAERLAEKKRNEEQLFKEAEYYAEIEAIREKERLAIQRALEAEKLKRLASESVLQNTGVCEVTEEEKEAYYDRLIKESDKTGTENSSGSSYNNELAAPQNAVAAKNRTDDVSDIPAASVGMGEHNPEVAGYTPAVDTVPVRTNVEGETAALSVMPIMHNFSNADKPKDDDRGKGPPGNSGSSHRILRLKRGNKVLQKKKASAAASDTIKKKEYRMPAGRGPHGEKYDLPDFFALHFSPENIYGMIPVTIKSGNNMLSAYSMRNDEAPQKIRHFRIRKNHDYYISASLYGKANSWRSEDLRSFVNIVADIDCHDCDVGIAQSLAKQAADIIRVYARGGYIPTPNTLVYTGRGLHIWWAVEAARCDAKWAQAAYKKAKEKIFAQLREILTIPDLQALSLDDTASSRASGLIRLPGSPNTKTGTISTFECLTYQKLDLEDYREDSAAARIYKARPEIDVWVKVPYEERDKAKELGLWYDKKYKLWGVPVGIDKGLYDGWPVINNAKEYVKTRKTPKHKAVSFIKGRGLKSMSCGAAIARVGKLERLFDMRQDINKGMRDKFLLQFYCALQFCMEKADAMEQVLVLNRRFSEPLSEDSVRKCLNSAIKKEYFYSNKRMASELNITPEECEEIGLFSGSERKRKQEERAREKRDRNQRIVELYRSGMKIRDIADGVCLSRKTVRSILLNEGVIKSRDAISKKMEEARRQGMTAAQAAAFCGVSKSTLYRMGWAQAENTAKEEIIEEPVFDGCAQDSGKSVSKGKFFAKNTQENLPAKMPEIKSFRGMVSDLRGVSKGKFLTHNILKTPSRSPTVYLKLSSAPVRAYACVHACVRACRAAPSPRVSLHNLPRSNPVYRKLFDSGGVILADIAHSCPTFGSCGYQKNLKFFQDSG